jgi:hypothetical protein
MSIATTAPARAANHPAVGVIVPMISLSTCS